MRRISEATASAHDCTAEVGYRRVFVPLVNDARATGHALTAARAVFGSDKVMDDAKPMGATADFAQALGHVPGNFANIGNGYTAVLHSPLYDFNDAALMHGVRYFAELTRQRHAVPVV